MAVKLCPEVRCLSLTCHNVHSSTLFVASSRFEVEMMVESCTCTWHEHGWLAFNKSCVPLAPPSYSHIGGRWFLARSRPI
jgi:hypothetical protein